MLSRLGMEVSPTTPAMYKELLLANMCFDSTKKDILEDAYPLTLKNIGHAWHADTTLLEKFHRDTPSHSLTAFCGGRKTWEVIT